MMKAHPVKRLDALFNRKNGWSGADGVYAYKYKDGYLFYFSDTILSHDKNGLRKDYELVHNSFAYVDASFKDASFYYDRPALISPSDDSFYWFMDATKEGDALFLFALKVKEGDEKSPFYLMGTDLLEIDLSDLNHLKAKRIASYPAGLIYGSALIKEEDAYYLFCYRDKSPKETLLAKTLSLSDPHFLFLQEDGPYLESSSKAKVISTFLPAESKIHHCNGRYYVAYSPNGISKEVRLTSFSELGETLKEGELIYLSPEANEVDITYNAKIQSDLCRDNQLIISYNVNSLDNKRVETTYLYRPHFLEVNL